MPISMPVSDCNWRLDLTRAGRSGTAGADFQPGGSKAFLRALNSATELILLLLTISGEPEGATELPAESWRQEVRPHACSPPHTWTWESIPWYRNQQADSPDGLCATNHRSGEPIFWSGEAAGQPHPGLPLLWTGHTRELHPRRPEMYRRQVHRDARCGRY